MNQTFKLSAAASAVALLFTANAADASHFRGGAMIPTVSSSGLLTITSTSFWRNGAQEDFFPTVSGPSSPSTTLQSSATDTSDARFTKMTTVSTAQLTGSGLYTLTYGSCCRVSGIQNYSGGSSTSWELTSQVFWNGSSATTPILFSFSAVQPEVVRGANYNGNLGATSLDGFTLTYNQALNPVIASQPPGFTINSSTGQLFIPAANTTTYADNTGGNVGADYSFSGNIFANTSGGSLRGQVEFEWVFDAVATGSQNLAPNVTDAIINALTAGQVNHTFTATDDGNPVPPGAVSFLAGLNFTPGCGGAATFNNSTGAFSWDATGCADGTYVAQVTATDGSLTDVGLLTINIGDIITPPPPTGAPEPGTLALLGAGLGIVELLRRRRRS